MTGYTKLFGSIIHSTVWHEPDRHRIVWVTLLAMADEDGVVDCSLPGLAQAAIVPLADAKSALDAFMAPDEYSRTPDFDGRRIEAYNDGQRSGWVLLNHGKYRGARDRDDRRAYNREFMRRKRAAEKAAKGGDSVDSVDPQMDDVGRGQPRSAQAEAEADTGKAKPPTPLPGAGVARAPRSARAKPDKLTLKAWLETLADGEHAIPKDHAVFEMAKNAGIPKGYLAIAWHVFREDLIDKLEKRQLDWRAAFQNYVRHNYFKLWRSTPDGYELTDKGIQAERELKGKGNGA